MEINSDINGFPIWALIPKKETGVISFLTKYPNYDGRGTTIAVFDSGIDPSAPGLQKTSDGRPKIIEMMDASGAGDVDTSTVVEETNGEIVGLTGRTLKIPSSWTNPTRKYHIGVKNAFELYPKYLKERIEKERKEKLWNSTHRVLVAEVTRKIQEFDNKHSNQQLSFEDKLEHEELEAQLEVLTNMDKKYLDVGPVYDCVVFHDGNMWRAAIDTSEKGDLETATLLGPYSQTQQYATLTEQDMLSYSINIHDEGNLLEIVGMSTAHGTHVASIAAAYFPDHPERNGIAPGAQIVSVGIGDIRLGSMETGTSLVRAIIKVMELKCDIINLSYGEHAHWSEGRIMNLVHEVVNNHGVIMVSSAGNHGPALSTVGTPPYMYSSSVIGVAAYCSTEMMKANYCLRELLPGTNYSWSSRGPSLDGDIGVSLCAPGGAITSVPRWTLRGTQLMNGTSMSSPHVAGAIALLLSGLKDKKIPYSPYSVRRAIENTALKVENWDIFSMGHGLLQVDKAFDHLLEHHKCPARDVRFKLTCGNHNRGIYYRETYKTHCTSLLNVVVEPIFLNEAKIEADKKIQFHLNLKLVVDKPWVSVGSHLNMYYASRFFSIKIDPLGLPEGLNFTSIKAYDVDCPEKGPLFHFPITVIIPKKPENVVCPKLIYKDLFVRSGQLYREFIDVPPGATWAKVTIESLDTKQDCHFVIHAVQLQKQSSCKTLEYYKIFHIPPEASITHVFPVKSGKVLELCIGKWWSSIGNNAVNVTAVFHGLEPDKPIITMHSAEGIMRVDLACKLNYEETSPSVSLKHHVAVLKPTDSKIQPLGKRDVVPTGHQIYELILTYNFNLAKSTEVTPTCALLSDLLYESEFESQLWMLFDTNKRLLACGDAYPNKYTEKLEKGDYVLKLQVRQEQKSLLEKLMDLPMLMYQKLSSPLSLDVYNTHANALVGGKKFASKCLLLGSTCPLFITSLPSDKIPKGAQPGHFLQGTISYAKDEVVKKVDTYPFKYIIAEIGSSKKSSNSTKGSTATSEKENKDKSQEEEYTEALRDLKISWLTKLDEKNSLSLFEELKAQDSNHIPLYHARLQAIDNGKERQNNLKEILSLANKILTLIDTKELLASFGAKTDKKDPASNTKNLEKLKNTVVDTLVRRGLALCDLIGQDIPDEAAHSPETGDALPLHQVTLEDINQVYRDLLKWVDTMDSKVSSFMERHALEHKHYGRVLKILHKQLDEKPSIEIEKKSIEIYRNLKWQNCVDLLESTLPGRYPHNYRLF